MRRALVLAALTAACWAGPAPARMSAPVAFGADLLPFAMSGGSQPMSGDLAGSLFERMFGEFANSAERQPRTKPRNDIEATLEAMEDARVGFGGQGPAGKTARKRGKARPKS